MYIYILLYFPLVMRWYIRIKPKILFIENTTEYNKREVKF